jgi:cyclase
MFRPRVIPVLLLKDGGLVNSVAFKKHKYIGDPINAVRIFNDLKADEVIFLDITASLENRTVDCKLIQEIGTEANMPFAVGGGINTIEHIRQVINAGAEKVIIGSAALLNPEFIREAATIFGSSTISVCIDCKKKMFRGMETWMHSGTKSSGISPLDFAHKMEEMGAGEIIVQSIENDGEMLGYDLGLIKSISEKVTIPVVALGGAGSLNDLSDGFSLGMANAVAAGSIFVYQGKLKGVLINYPESKDFFSIK